MATPLEKWVDEQARLFEPKHGLLVRRFGGRGPPAHRDGHEGGEDRTHDIFRELTSPLAQSLSPPQSPHGCRPDRTADLRLPFGQGKHGSEQQLEGPERSQGAADEAFPGRDAGKKRCTSCPT